MNFIERLIDAILSALERPARDPYELVAYREGDQAYRDGKAASLVAFVDDRLQSHWLDGYCGRP